MAAKLRLTEGLAALSEGETPARVAAAVGYSSGPAFGAAFRSVFGITPGRSRRGAENTRAENQIDALAASVDVRPFQLGGTAIAKPRWARGQFPARSILGDIEPMLHREAPSVTPALVASGRFWQQRLGISPAPHRIKHQLDRLTEPQRVHRVVIDHVVRRYVLVPWSAARPDVQ